MSKILNNTFSSIVFAGDLNTATINLFRAVVQLPSKIIALLYTWQTRLDDRKHIAELSDWQLKDIGLSRILADSESQKPFLIPWWCIHSIITPWRTEQSGPLGFLFLDFALSVRRHWSFLTAHLCETYPMTKSHFQMMARFGAWTNQRLITASKWRQSHARTMAL